MDLAEQTDLAMEAYVASVAVGNKSRAEHFNQSWGRVVGSCGHTPKEALRDCCYSAGVEDCHIYNDIDDVNAYIFLGMYLYKYCDLVNHLVESVISYVIGGNEITYRVVPRETACANGTAGVELSRVQCIVDNTITNTDWMREFHRDALARQHVTGDVLRRIEYLEDGNIEARYIEPYQLTNLIENPGRGTEPITGIPFASLQQRAPFGIAHAAERVRNGRETLFLEDGKKPIAYIVEEPFVQEDGSPRNGLSVIYPSVEIQHLKFGVDSAAPRGVTPWYRTFDSSVGKHEVLISARKLMLRRAENSVIEKVMGGASDVSIGKMIDSQKRKEKERKEETGSQFAHGGRKVTRNVEVEYLNLQLGMADIINLTETDALRIAKQINAPDFIALARSDMGARATSDNSVRPWNARVRTTQKQISNFNVDFLWHAIGWNLFPMDGPDRIDMQQLRELRRFYKIESEGFSDPAQDVQGAHDRAIDRFDRNIDTKEQVALSGGSTYDAEKKCEELQNNCDIPEEIEEV